MTHKTIADLLADGTITPETRVMGTLPMTKDRVIVGEHPEETGHTLWCAWYGPNNTLLFSTKKYQSFMPSCRDVGQFSSTREAAERAAKELTNGK